MKFNYKNTALSFLEHPETMDFYLPEDNKNMTMFEREDFKYSVKQAFKSTVKMPGIFNQKIRFISRPFQLAYLKGKHKLSGLWDKEDIDEAGTMIFSDGQVTNTVFYYIKSPAVEKAEDYDLEYVFIQFHKHAQAEQQHLDVWCSQLNDSKREYMWKGFSDKGCTSLDFISYMIGLLVFLRYCDIETKIVNAKRKEHHAGQKYVNETPFKIEVLDSSWFTNIVHSEAFKVGGHFRMQPYGPGRSQKKLIWIADFVKEGYTRKAKAVTEL